MWLWEFRKYGILAAKKVICTLRRLRIYGEDEVFRKHLPAKDKEFTSLLVC